MPETHRLFFALWPDEAVRRGVVERRETLGKVSRRRVPNGNLHLTLVFLGDQPVRRLLEIQRAAGRLKARTCSLDLDRFGWFAAARVLWLGGEAPEPLTELQSRLQRAMLELGLDLDRRPFRPHVTLFRQVARCPDLPVPEPLSWPVVDFALIESVPGRPYTLLARWPLSR